MGELPQVSDHQETELSVDIEDYDVRLNNLNILNRKDYSTFFLR